MMKAHPYDPHHLAQAIGTQGEDLTPTDVLADMREFPDLYFPDHVVACHRDGVLPLSALAWRRACLAA